MKGSKSKSKGKGKGKKALKEGSMKEEAMDRKCR